MVKVIHGLALKQENRNEIYQMKNLIIQPDTIKMLAKAMAESGYDAAKRGTITKERMLELTELVFDKWLIKIGYKP